MKQHGVFVTDGNQRATLAVVRALGHAGIPVTVGEAEPTSLAGSSRHCAERVSYPSPWTHGQDFQSFLKNELRRGKYQVLLPMSDLTVRLAAEVRETLDSTVQLPVPSHEQIEIAQDKRQMLLLAQRLRLGCPETILVDGKESIEDVAQRVRYPVVIKPRFSRFLQADKWMAGTVEYAYYPADLVAKFHRCHGVIPDPLVQEKIDGEGRGAFLLVWNGELKAAFCHRRLREKPPSGGVSVYSESIPFDEDLIQQSLALLRAIGWQGVAMVEFKLDRRDGRPKFMEVNGRFWGSLQLAIDAGLNFPVLLYRLAMGENPATQLSYQVGVKSRWLFGDLDSLIIRLTHPLGSNGSKGPKASRLRACASFLKFYERNLHYDVFRLGDPRPGWFECKSYFREMLRLGQPQEQGNEN